jgi:hypothetical protein
LYHHKFGWATDQGGSGTGSHGNSNTRRITRSVAIRIDICCFYYLIHAKLNGSNGEHGACIYLQGREAVVLFISIIDEKVMVAIDDGRFGQIRA